jgi:hypothetical protein
MQVSREELEAGQVFYSEASQALERQEAKLDELRNRTSLLLASGGLAGAIFSGRIASTAWNWLYWLACLSFLGMTVCVMLILWPSAGWVFRLRVDKIVEHAEQERLAVGQLQKTLALAKWKHFCSNEELVNQLFHLFRWACLFLVLELLLWFLVAGLGE